MTILSAQSIRLQEGMVTPFVLRSVAHGMSYGLSVAGYDIRIAESLSLYPGMFRLASSVEYFNMPTQILARVADKSTWARRGLAVQNTVIEPGWRGHLTLELTNHSERMINLQAGMPIAQIIFEWLDQPTDQPYNGKYQDQPAGAVPAKLEE